MSAPMGIDNGGNRRNARSVDGIRLGGWLLASIALATLLLPRTASACAACYGASDSPMAAGMNWGIMALLGMIVAVLGGIASCFFVLARRSAAVPKATREAALLAQAEASWPVVAENPKPAEGQSIPDRGGLKQFSTLAQQRKNCAPVHSARGLPTAPRVRG